MVFYFHTSICHFVLRFSLRERVSFQSRRWTANLARSSSYANHALHSRITRASLEQRLSLLHSNHYTLFLLLRNCHPCFPYYVGVLSSYSFYYWKGKRARRCKRAYLRGIRFSFLQWNFSKKPQYKTNLHGCWVCLRIHRLVYVSHWTTSFVGRTH